MGKTQPPFVYFRPPRNTMTSIVQNLTMQCKSVDGVLGTRTQEC